MRVRSYDNLLMALMGLVACLSLYMLYGARYFTRGSDHEISIASITDQVNTVKRKKDFYQSWMDASLGEGLAQNDEIYTHGQSSARIHFNNGPEVQLYENSLLRIKSNSVALEKGNLTAKLSPEAKKLEVQLNGKNYTFESSSANIQIEQGKTENKFLITDGDARLKLGDKNETLKPNQVLIQNKKSGEIKVKEIPFVLTAPATNLLSWFVGEKKLNFEWSFTTKEATKEKKPVQFVLARDAAFSKIVTKETVEGTHFETSLKEEGTYFWKIERNDENEIISSPLRTFTLKEERPLSLQLDKDILYKGPKGNASVSLHWPRGEARHYELKIEEDKVEPKIIVLDQNRYDYTSTKIGETKFSVKVKEVARPEAIWGPSSLLTVLEAKSIQITSILPDTLEKINYTNKEFSQLLSWNGPSSGITYSIKVHHDGSEKNFKSETLSFPLQLTKAGDYTWEVQGETETGVLTNVIKGKITVKVPLKIAQTPAEGSVIELEKPDQTVAFKWDAANEKNSEKNIVYAFELATDPNFQKTIVTKESEANSLSTTVGQTGRYFWRVKIKKGDKTEYSAPVSVDIRPTPPLSRPEIAPDLKIKMKFLEENRSEHNLIDLFFARAYADEPVAVAEWDLPASSRAKTYIVEIYEDPNLTKLITRIETTVPHIVWKKAKSGTFFWRMSYEDFWGRKTEFSKTAKLETSIDESLIKKPEPELPPPPPPIELIAPKHREDILATSEDEKEFSWEEVPNVKTYLFHMARDVDFKDTVFTKKISGTKLIIHCEDIKSEAGEFYWKVTAENASGSKRRMARTVCEEKKNPEPEPSKEIPVVIEKVPEKKPLRLAGISYSPHRLSYTNKATAYSVDVSGNVLNSWSAFYQSPLDAKYFTLISTDAMIERGKVFSTTTFTDLNFNLRFHHVVDDFHFGPVLSFMKKTLYEETNLTAKDKSQTVPLFGAFVRKDLEAFSALAEIKFAGAMVLYAEGSRSFKKNFSAGPFVQLLSMNKDGGKHQFTSFGLKLNYTFFLEENK